MRKLPQAQELFIECMGLAAEAEGLPRIAGYMNGLFFLLGNPFSFLEPAERLRVSRASVSINARILRDLGIIERISRPTPASFPWIGSKTRIIGCGMHHYPQNKWPQSRSRPVPTGNEASGLPIDC